MRVEVRGSKGPVSAPLRERARRRLFFSLARLDEGIKRVSVRLSQVRGDDGVVQRCRMRIVMKAGGAVVVEATQSDVYAALDLAAGRAGRALERCLAHRRDAGAGAEG